MANEQNLTPWPKGVSGNLNGKPKGTKHLSTWIQELLNDEGFATMIPDKQEGWKEYKGAPLKAILKAMALKAMSGDTKAFDALAKYGYGQKIDVEAKGNITINLVSYDTDTNTP